MNPITVPIHLFLPAVLSLLVLLWILAKRKEMFENRKGKANWIALVIFLTIYGLVVGGATYDDIKYQKEINRFDLNGDGFFSGKEITAEQEEAMGNLTHDTGRNISVFTGLIFAALVALPTYFTLRIAGKNR
jgi:hypothetical protein